MGERGQLEVDAYRDVVRRALEEDIGSGDITSEATVDTSQQGRALLLAKSACIIAGLPVALETFRQIDPGVNATFYRHDGDRCAAGDCIAEFSGPARALLAGERTALNFLQRLSGIATLTRRFSALAAGRIIVLDTRKTTPTLRALEKYAVRAGGAANHRVGLFDGLLIKDNHIRLAGGVRPAVESARGQGRSVEVEVQCLTEVDEALDAGVDTILADNMSSDDIRETVRRARGRARVEISGGVTLDRMADLAATGADAVSVGALTHSAPAVDLSLEIEPS